MINSTFLIKTQTLILTFLIAISSQFWVLASSTTFKEACVDIVCKSNLNLRLEIGQKYPISAKDFLDLGYDATHQYRIDALINGQVVTIDTLSSSLPRILIIFVRDLTTGSNCMCTLSLEFVNCLENFFPQGYGKRYYEKCKSLNGLFEDIGFGLPPHVTIDSVTQGVWLVKHWAKCSDVTIRIVDIKIVNAGCNSSYPRITYRRWAATTPFGLQFTFQDTLYTERNSIDDLPKLYNYDGTDFPAIDCYNPNAVNIARSPKVEFVAGDFNKAIGCNFTFNYWDSIVTINSAYCNDSRLIFRNYTVIDWCNQIIKNFTQKIQVNCSKDSIAPIAKCKSNFNINFTLNEYTFNAIDLNEGSTDDCMIANFSFDPEGKMLSKKLIYNNTPHKFDIDLWVHDRAGNKSVCISKIETSINTAVHVEEKNWNIAIHPNPSTHESGFYITTDQDDRIQIKLLNIQGQYLMNEDHFFEKNKAKHFKINYLSEGIYFVKIINSKHQSITRKLIISH